MKLSSTSAQKLEGMDQQGAASQAFLAWSHKYRLRNERECWQALLSPNYFEIAVSCLVNLT